MSDGAQRSEAGAEAELTPTQLLRGGGASGVATRERLFELVYAELHQLASGYMKRERSDHTLQPTILVHDAFLKMIDQTGVTWEDRGHFFALAARCMRQLLVDHARRRGAQKRGSGWEQVSLSEAFTGRALGPEALIQLDEALERLASKDARVAQVVEMRFFGGLTIAEVARVLDVADSTVELDWKFARAWLGRELES